MPDYPEPPPDVTTDGLLCACGNGPDPSERPSTGLYIDKYGNLAFICLPCWQREACDIVSN